MPKGSPVRCLLENLKTLKLTPDLRVSKLIGSKWPLNGTFESIILRDLHLYCEWSRKWKRSLMPKLLPIFPPNPLSAILVYQLNFFYLGKLYQMTLQSSIQLRNHPLTATDLSLQPLLRPHHPQIPLLTRLQKSLLAEPLQTPPLLLAQQQAAPIMLHSTCFQPSHHSFKVYS